MTDTKSGPGTKMKRSRTACITCKIRRVKCDETRPHCKRCTTTGRTCDGYLHLAPFINTDSEDHTRITARNQGQTQNHSHLPSRRALADMVRGLASVGPASRVLTTLSDASESACFDFFRLRAARVAGGFFPSAFWGSLLLQAAHAEPAVWSAAVALGALHRRWETSGAIPLNSESMASAAQFAAQVSRCYGRALALSRDITRPAFAAVLSLALAAVASLSGRWSDRPVHVGAGQRLLREIERESSSSRAKAALVVPLDSSSELYTVAESLTQMELQGVFFTEASAQYPYHESDLPERGKGRTIPRGSSQYTVPSNEDDDMGLTINDLGEAMTMLVALMGRLMVLHGREAPTGKSSDRDLYLEEQIKSEIAAWEASLTQYLVNRTGDTSVRWLQEQQTALLPLKLYHALLRMALKIGIAGSQMRYDVCLPHFERIVAVSWALLLMSPQTVVSVDVGIILPLYVTSTRCRHPVVRRNAVAFLRQANRLEGMFQSRPAASIADKRISIEEAGFGYQGAAYFSSAQLERCNGEICCEKPLDWLGSDAGWVTRLSSWEGIVRVPEKQRLADVTVAADADAMKATLTLIYHDVEADGQGRRRVDYAEVDF